jgi:hypothetical protein
MNECLLLDHFHEYGNEFEGSLKHDINRMSIVKGDAIERINEMIRYFTDIDEEEALKELKTLIYW